MDVKLKGSNIKYPEGKEQRNFTLATCCLPGILAATHDKRRKRMNNRAAELPLQYAFLIVAYGVMEGIRYWRFVFNDQQGEDEWITGRH